MTEAQAESFQKHLGVEFHVEKDNTYRIKRNILMRKDQALQYAKIFNVSVRRKSSDWKSQGVVFDKQTLTYKTVVGDGRIYPYLYSKTNSRQHWEFGPDLSGVNLHVKGEKVDKPWFFDLDP